VVVVGAVEKWITHKIPVGISKTPVDNPVDKKASYPHIHSWDLMLKSYPQFWSSYPQLYPQGYPQFLPTYPQVYRCQVVQTVLKIVGRVIHSCIVAKEPF